MDIEPRFFTTLAITVLVLAGGISCRQTKSTPTADQPSADFESKYKDESFEELEIAAMLVQQRLEQATRARFDELYSQFPRLLAEGGYGAQILVEGHGLFTPVSEPGRPKLSDCRTGRSPAGLWEFQYLEFFVDEEPLIARLTAEQEWIRARRKVLAKRD